MKIVSLNLFVLADKQHIAKLRVALKQSRVRPEEDLALKPLGEGRTGRHIGNLLEHKPSFYGAARQSARKELSFSLEPAEKQEQATS